MSRCIISCHCAFLCYNKSTFTFSDQNKDCKSESPSSVLFLHRKFQWMHKGLRALGKLSTTELTCNPNSIPPLICSSKLLWKQRHLVWQCVWLPLLGGFVSRTHYYTYAPIEMKNGEFQPCLLLEKENFHISSYYKIILNRKKPLRNKQWDNSLILFYFVYHTDLLTDSRHLT